MKFEYDGTRDLLYIRFGEASKKVARTETVRPGVHADFDIHDKLMGIEIIDALEIMGNSIEFKLPEHFTNKMSRAPVPSPGAMGQAKAQRRGGFSSK